MAKTQEQEAEDCPTCAGYIYLDEGRFTNHRNKKTNKKCQESGEISPSHRFDGYREGLLTIKCDPPHSIEALIQPQVLDAWLIHFDGERIPTLCPEHDVEVPIFGFELVK